MSEYASISEAEWEIMRIIWANPSIATKEIIQIIQQKKAWSTSTIKTLLARLVEKHYIDSTKIGKGFSYVAVIPEEHTVARMAHEACLKLCDTKIPSYIYTIVAETPISRKDIDRLQQLLEEKKKTAPETVQCHCIPGQCHCAPMSSEKCKG